MHFVLNANKYLCLPCCHSVASTQSGRVCVYTPVGGFTVGILLASFRCVLFFQFIASFAVVVAWLFIAIYVWTHTHTHSHMSLVLCRHCFCFLMYTAADKCEQQQQKQLQLQQQEPQQLIATCHCRRHVAFTDKPQLPPLQLLRQARSRLPQKLATRIFMRQVGDSTFACNLQRFC